MVTFSEPARARLVYALHLTPGRAVTLPFTLVAGAGGEGALRAVLAALPDWATALAGTQAAYEAILTTALLHTPDARINRGLGWAKANTVRVQHQYRQGVGFTNDPPQDIVVVRDCAWYALGADWLTPDFVQAMNTLLLQYGIEDGGKLTEYLHADTGQREDYALNINDDTPLFVVAAAHHYAVSGAGAFLERVYPVVRAACAWILAQRQEGLVWCTVQGSDVWGNATWRNIIPGYTLVGAVTEINALCAWALREAAALALAAGQAADAATWRAAAVDLDAAINTRLGTSDGLYLLNLHAGGANPTRTADLVFPVLGGVAEPERAERILDLLYGPSFYTPYGIHTVAADEAEYHPNFGHGLMGGLWPNLTAWVAFAGRARYPDRLAAMMSSLYALCEVADPAAEGHLVPGEFPEWFDGETLESRGMAMSPWMPPTYVWLGVEGLAGVTPRPDGLVINPNLPPDWGWLALRNLPYRGGRLSCFVHGGRLHTTLPVESALPQTVYAADVSDELAVTGGLLAVALAGDSGVTVLVGTTEATEGTVRYGRQSETVRLRAGESTLLQWPGGDGA
jgi:glycogen debranching enzyme